VADPKTPSRAAKQRRSNSVMGLTNASTDKSVMTSPAMTRGKPKNGPIRHLRSDSVPDFAATTDKVIITTTTIDLGGMESDPDIKNQM
jgi:hypothetical protein